VFVWLPCVGTLAKDTQETASQAALARDGKFVAQAGRGRFRQRELNHF
jgi:hypothetical protein